jgi:hypothetical protein
MASVSFSIGVAVLTFGVGLLGLYLKRLVPERHMSAGSRDMIGAVIGLLSLLLALVLGTLVRSANRRGGNPEESERALAALGSSPG